MAKVSRNRIIAANQRVEAMSYAHPEYLISPAELAADLDGRRILDVTVFFAPTPDGGFSMESGLARFNEGHIPGALFLDLVGDASDTSTGLGFTLPPVAQLERLFARLGVSNDTETVLYSSGHMMWATRAWWLLRYCGHRRARVLNGGLTAWRDGGHPMSTDAASHPEGNFKATPDAALFADRDAVLAAIGDGDVCTVNALSPEMYAGEGDFSYGRKGHIAGSINLHYEDLLEDGCFKDGEALRQGAERQWPARSAPSDLLLRRRHLRHHRCLRLPAVRQGRGGRV